jgi:predicted acetyltransferase
VAILVAAEYPIYGRFGYGPATEACAIRIDASGPELWVDPPTGSTELLDNAPFTDELIALYNRARTGISGHMTYEDARWQITTGELAWPDGREDQRRNATKVVWRDGDGVIQALASYSVKDNWVDNRPQNTLDTSVVVAATDEGEREMVRYLTAVDWVTTVHLGTRPNDDPVPLWLRDGRAATLHDRSDHVWARLLDVPAALEARRYTVDGRLVFEIDDPLGFAHGRFALEGGPDGATCKTTTDDPDLRIPAKALGAAYLGGFTWSRLAAAGWVDESRPGALATAAAMFFIPRLPWCAMTF